MQGVIFFAHGSSVESANEAVRKVASEAARQAEVRHFAAAFLELAHPTLDEAAAGLIVAGIDHIVVVPYFLSLGIHLQRDLPAIVSRISRAHPHIQISVTPPLDEHPGLATLLADRARTVWKE